ncbi:Uncharacterised protein [Serratia fonticola]|uniref:Uncharacterized protein n=1 Tax=Serratia fonticola TaxID=47917 RepID=A0A4U9VV18_SERFO|nr:Uncharacterised protein [Serratia fonticola]
MQWPAVCGVDKPRQKRFTLTGNLRQCGNCCWRANTGESITGKGDFRLVGQDWYCVNAALCNQRSDTKFTVKECSVAIGRTAHYA